MLVIYSLVCLFLIIGPFTNRPTILFLHIVTCITLIIHWYTRSNACALANIESWITNNDIENTVTHKIVSPIYDINNKVVYVITILLMLLSLYKLYTFRDQLASILLCFKETKDMISYHECLQKLFLPLA